MRTNVDFVRQSLLFALSKAKPTVGGTLINRFDSQASMNLELHRDSDCC